VGRSLGVQPNDNDPTAGEFSDEEVGANVLFVGDDEDCCAAQNPFWSSPVSRSAFLVDTPELESIASVKAGFCR
jgi:uncharacterized membrane protein